MKLRIKGDSLRLRVSRSEVARLFAGDCLEETIHFAPEAGATFTYALQQKLSVSTTDRSIRREQIDDSNTLPTTRTSGASPIRSGSPKISAWETAGRLRS